METATNMNTEYALTVRGAYKRYGPNNVVLKGLNMTIPQGTIYGLLGPSGCGKTTLLNLIVGRVELDAGDIELKGQHRSDLGYMPQDVALYTVLSIAETFLYYGRLFELDYDHIERRTEELVKLLELPSPKTLVENLSGGQQRRVSFAVALIHDPELLILDEPTVGLDPLLSQSIWEHLLALALKSKKTILITTHYIEEARQAHTIGLMRGGVLLCEESPMNLMTTHNCNNLEQAFLQLSHKQHTATNNNDDDPELNYPRTDNRKKKRHLKREGWFLWSKFVAQLMKNWFFLWRNKAMIVFLFGLPIVQCTLYNLAIGRDPEGLTVAVVNDELLHGLDDCPLYPSSGCNLDQPLTCRYIDKLRNRTMNIVEYPNLKTAQSAVSLHKTWGFLYFAPNYSLALVSRLNFTRSTPRHLVDETVNRSQLHVWMDMSNHYIGNMLKEDVIESYVEFLQDLYGDCGWPVQAAALPFQFKEPVYGNRHPSFIHFASPAVIIVFMFYLPMMFTVGVLLYEKMAGILERCMVAGVTALEIISAHSVIQFVVLIFQGFFMMIIMYQVFDSPFVGNFFWTTNLLILQGLSGMCFGFFISVVSDNMNTASFMGIGSFFPLCSMSGMLWPQEGMHPILKTISWSLPTSLPTEAMRALTARGWSVTHPAVYKGFMSSFAWIIIFCLLTRVVLKAKNGLHGRKKSIIIKIEFRPGLSIADVKMRSLSSYFSQVNGENQAWPRV